MASIEKYNGDGAITPPKTMEEIYKSSHKIISIIIVAGYLLIMAVYLVYESTKTEPDIVAVDIEPILQKAVSAITEDIAFKKSKGSRRDIKISADLRAKAIAEGTKGDSASLKKAIIMLNQSLEFQYSAETMIDLAYYYSCLGHIGENPGLNFIRSKGILDGLKLAENSSTKAAVQSTSLKILNKIRRGALKKARKMFYTLKELFSGKEDIMSEYPIFLEAWYFLEKDRKKRARISEDLVRRSPKNPVYYNYMGVANYHADEKNIAEQCFERAVAINSKYTPAVKNYILIRQNRKPVLKITSRLTEKWKKEPDNFLYSLGSILTRKVGINGKQTAFLSVHPEDTKIEVNRVDLDIGKYQLEISSEGYVKKSLWVDLYSDANLDINLNLKAFTNLIGIDFVYIKPGSFIMGSPWILVWGSSESDRRGENTQHKVTLSNGFYMQTTEVTQGQWHEVMGTRPWSGKKYVQEGEKYPAVYISWKDAQEFIRRMNKKEGGNKYRLPTEAEWEYALRAGTTTLFSFGDDEDKLTEYAWYSKNSKRQTQRVANKKPNPWGLYDMHGNVWEWVEDDWHGNYNGAPDDGRAWLDEPRGAGRVVRGGGWGSSARSCRSANRRGRWPGYRRFIGFRLSRSVALGP